MKVLEYYWLDKSKVLPKYEKVVRLLEEEKFQALDIKKLTPFDIYRVKLDNSNRLLFKFVSYEEQTFILVLEVVLNHDYDKTRTLRGAKVNEEEVILSLEALKKADTQKLTYLNPHNNTFFILDKILSFSVEQNEIFKLSPPIIIIGPAGSGKTAVIVEKMRTMAGKGIYVTLSKYLAENTERLYYSNNYENDQQEISFLSLREFFETIEVPSGKEITFRVFKQWFERLPKSLRIGDAHRVFEEFEGVLLGGAENGPYLGEEEYLELGVKKSIFLPQERPLVYELFQKYLRFLSENSYFDLNLLAYQYLDKVSPFLDFVVVDEVQDLTNLQLRFILSNLKQPQNFILVGDSNQIVHPNFFSWATLKTTLYKTETPQPSKVIRILNNTFRNSISVTEVSNRILKVKQKRFGSIDKESNYLMNTVSKEKGKVELLPDLDKVKIELNKKIRRSTKFAIIVMRDEQKQYAKKFFDNPLLFSVHEAKGLEYENVILLNFVSDERKNFLEIIQGIKEEDLESDLKYSRASDKTDKSLEAYKFFINSFYVGLTRAVKAAYVIEKDTGHPFLKLLGLRVESQGAPVLLQAEESSKEDWEMEARRLELQGKVEQAEEIRRVILKKRPVPWEVFDQERLQKILCDGSAQKEPSQGQKKGLFELGLLCQSPLLIRVLSQKGYDKAKQIYYPEGDTLKFSHSMFKQHLKSLQDRILKRYSSIFYKEILKEVEVYGVDYRSELNRTPIMYAAEAGNVELVKGLLERGANTQLVDSFGMNAWQIAFRRALLEPEFANNEFCKIHHMIVPSSIDLKIGDRLVKLHRSQGEFLIFNVIYVLFHHFLVELYSDSYLFSPSKVARLISNIPDSIIAPYRKKGSYVSAIMAKNEVSRQDIYSKAILLRITRGLYFLNPDLSVRIGDEWIPLFRLMGLNLLVSSIGDSPKIEDFSSLLAKTKEKLEIQRLVDLAQKASSKGNISVSRKGQIKRKEEMDIGTMAQSLLIRTILKMRRSMEDNQED